MRLRFLMITNCFIHLFEGCRYTVCEPPVISSIAAAPKLFFGVIHRRYIDVREWQTRENDANFSLIRVASTTPLLFDILLKNDGKFDGQL